MIFLTSEPISLTTVLYPISWTCFNFTHFRIVHSLMSWIKTPFLIFNKRCTNNYRGLFSFLFFIFLDNPTRLSSHVFTAWFCPCLSALLYPTNWQVNRSLNYNLPFWPQNIQWFLASYPVKVIQVGILIICAMLQVLED